MDPSFHRFDEAACGWSLLINGALPPLLSSTSSAALHAEECAVDDSLVWFAWCVLYGTFGTNLLHCFNAALGERLCHLSFSDWKNSCEMAIWEPGKRNMYISIPCPTTLDLAQ
jgi:hypothetical protein